MQSSKPLETSKGVYLFFFSLFFFLFHQTENVNFWNNIRDRIRGEEEIKKEISNTKNTICSLKKGILRHPREFYAFEDIFRIHSVYPRNMHKILIKVSIEFFFFFFFRNTIRNLKNWSRKILLLLLLLLLISSRHDKFIFINILCMFDVSLVIIVVIV